MQVVPGEKVNIQADHSACYSNKIIFMCIIISDFEWVLLFHLFKIYYALS